VHAPSAVDNINSAAREISPRLIRTFPIS
jgi:hypothetical protein